jgi:hypothetical protein
VPFVRTEVPSIAAPPLAEEIGPDQGRDFLLDAARGQAGEADQLAEVQLPAGVDEGLGEHRETRRRADDGDRGHTCILQAYDRMARTYNARRASFADAPT